MHHAPKDPAGPITYKLTAGGKQYLVVAPGGHVGLGSALGDYVIAYALPDQGAAAPAPTSEFTGHPETVSPKEDER